MLIFATHETNAPSISFLFPGYAEGKYDEALSLYTKAIELNPKVPAYYGNRSFCYVKTEYYGYALEDANKAIELDKTYIKVCSMRFQFEVGS